MSGNGTEDNGFQSRNSPWATQNTHFEETLENRLIRLEEENRELKRIRDVVVPHMEARIRRYEATSQPEFNSDFENMLKDSEALVQELQEKVEELNKKLSEQESAQRRIGELEEEKRNLETQLQSVQEQHLEGKHAQDIAELNAKLTDSEEVVRLLQEQLDTVYQQNHHNVVDNIEETQPKLLFNEFTQEEARRYKDEACRYERLYADLKDQYEQRLELFERRELELCDMMVTQDWLRDAECKLAEMESQIATKDEHLRCEQEKYDELTTEYKNLQLHHQALENDVREDPRKEVMEETEEVRRLKICNTDLCTALLVKAQDMEKLKEKLNGAESNAEQLQKRYSEASAALEQQSLQLRGFTDAMKENDERIKRLSEELSNEHKNIAYLRETQVDRNQQQERLIEELEEKVREKDTVIQVMRSTAADIDNLKAANQFLEQRLADKETAINSLQKTVNQNTREIDLRDQEVMLWRNRYDKAMDEKSDIENELMKKLASPVDSAAITEDLQALKSQHEQLQSHLRDKEAEVKFLRDELRKNQKKYDDALKEKRSTESMLQQKIHELEKRAASGQLLVSAAGQGSDHSLIQKMSGLMSDVTAKKNKIEVLDKRCREEEQKNAQLERHVKVITAAMQKLEEQKQTLLEQWNSHIRACRQQDWRSQVAPQFNDEYQGTGRFQDGSCHSYAGRQLAVPVHSHMDQPIQGAAASYSCCELLETKKTFWELQNKRAESLSKLEVGQDKAVQGERRNDEFDEPDKKLRMNAQAPETSQRPYSSATPMIRKEIVSSPVIKKEKAGTIPRNAIQQALTEHASMIYSCPPYSSTSSYGSLPPCLPREHPADLQSLRSGPRVHQQRSWSANTRRAPYDTHPPRESDV